MVVVACDQFTSEPEYWEQVKRIVGDSPSTFHLILPEIYLGKPRSKSARNASNFRCKNTSKWPVRAL